MFIAFLLFIGELAIIPTADSAAVLPLSLVWLACWVFILLAWESADPPAVAMSLWQRVKLEYMARKLSRQLIRAGRMRFAGQRSGR